MAPSPPDETALQGFTLGAAYTRNEIYAALEGSKRSAIPTVDGVVVAVCIRTDLSANAPAEFLCGAGPIFDAMVVRSGRSPSSVRVAIELAP